MSQRTKRELLEVTRPRYLKANKTGKERILDEFVASTGYQRKYAIRVLKHGHKAKGVHAVGTRSQFFLAWHSGWGPGSDVAYLPGLR